MSASEQAAADWLIARDRGLTPTQQAEFTAWLCADARHAEIFAELEETWARLGELRETAPAATEQAPAAAVRSGRRGKLVWLATGLGIAAALTFMWANWSRPAPMAPDYSLTAATGIGESRKLTLPDGSSVQLNTQSAVMVSWTGTERRVQLVRGEAHFQVAKNPVRPFIVSAGEVAVRAVGTAFDVRLQPETVEVLVTEGRVRVNDATKGTSLLTTATATGDEPVLVAGQRAIVSVTAAPGITATVVTLDPAEIGQATSWQSGRLEFVATPLASIVEEFNRYNRHQLVIVDPRLATRRFGGTFAVGDHEELVRSLEANFGVVAERGENTTRLRLAP
ncbi:MAG TPA: FecR domain-containing protein [Opitutaceae bacterium]|nr:FecR domain-containing protein [Opitutaceae bacterium]